MTSTDELFSTLPPSLQQRIDTAFAQAYYSHFPPVNEAYGGGGFLASSPAPGGGFLPPSPPSASLFGGGGGFLPPSRSPSPGPSSRQRAASHPTPTQLPLRLVPAALRLLSLPPDDEVLAVFANAAGGWAHPGTEPGLGRRRAAEVSDDDDDNEGEGKEKYVAIADWRSVCAVLLEDADADMLPGPSSPSATADDQDHRMRDLDAASDSDEYTGIEAPDDEVALSSPLSSASASSDDFRLPGAKAKGKRGKTTRTRAPAEVDKSKNPTKAQRAVALSTFALFFPDADADATEESTLAARRLGMTDVQRAAQVLGEKIKAEEMHDMLALFSSAPDGSMSLDDFARMMLAAELL